MEPEDRLGEVEKELLRGKSSVDDRKLSKYPYNCLVLVVCNDFQGVGTGFVVADNAIMTARHVVMKEKKKKDSGKIKWKMSKDIVCKIPQNNCGKESTLKV